MVHTLIRLRIAIMRHNYRGSDRSIAIWGVALGLIVSAITWVIGLGEFQNPTIHRDVMALALGVWTAGWALGPTLFGREDTTLRPEHYRYLPVSINRLAFGLLCASVVSIGVVVSALAFTSLAAYAARLGAAAVIVSVPALVLQLVFTVTLSRFATSGLRRLRHSQLSTLISTAAIAIVQAFLVTGWAIFAIDTSGFSDGFPAYMSALVNLSPSGWSVVAITAANGGNWLLVFASLSGLVIGSATFAILWARLLHLRMTTTRERTSSTKSLAWLLERVPASPTGAVVRKEFQTWIRDQTRSGHFYFAFFYAAALCLFPLAAGIPEALPWAGALFVFTAVGATSNVYGYDGSALWLTLTTPDAMQHDIRGRQTAWLVLAAPIAIVLTLGFTVAGQQTGMLLPAISAVIAGLGTGAGVVVLASVYWLIPSTDPSRQKDNSGDESIDPGKFLSIFIAVAALTAPSLVITLLGQVQNVFWIEIVGVLVSLAIGAVAFWVMGNLAIRRLEAQGPELLTLMIKGPPETVETEKETGEPAEVSGWVGVYVTAGAIFLFPQSIMPVVFNLIGTDARVWFLPLFLSGVWQWLAILIFGALGILLLGKGWMAYQEARSGDA